MGSRSAPSVLIAEDDPNIRMTLELLFEDEGLDLHFASNGEEALELAHRLRPQVMVLDHMMPRKDGRAVVEELKADEETRSIPVVILSGVARGEEQDWRGAEFLRKPFSPDELLHTIRSLLPAI